jgi:type II secretory pathway pseudopilin PulG
MLVVVAIVGVLAAVAVPSADPLSSFKVDAVAAELAHAVRFAQREAVRTGERHIVSVEQASQTIRLYRMTTSGQYQEDPLNKVLHPIDKGEYRLALSHNPALGATIASVKFNFGGSDMSTVAFDAAGAPINLGNTASAPTEPLKTGEVTLQHGRLTRTVRIAPVTGRVSF